MVDRLASGNGGGSGVNASYTIATNTGSTVSYGNSPITITKFLSEKDFSFVELSVDLTRLTGEPRSIVVKGLAKRNPVDKPNPELSDALALSRAFYSLQKRLERRAAGLIKQQDDLVAAKEEVKAAKTKKRGRR